MAECFENTIPEITESDVCACLAHRFEIEGMLNARLRELYAWQSREIEGDEAIEAATFTRPDPDKVAMSAPTGYNKDLSDVLRKVYAVRREHLKDIDRLAAGIITEMEKYHRIYSAYLSLPDRLEHEVLRMIYVEPEAGSVGECMRLASKRYRISEKRLWAVRKHAIESVIDYYYRPLGIRKGGG